jgi:hypothetical protein
MPRFPLVPRYWLCSIYIELGWAAATAKPPEKDAAVLSLTQKLSCPTSGQYIWASEKSLDKYWQAQVKT